MSEVKNAAESIFKPQEVQPGRKTHVAMETISDAELERRLNELQNERMRRIEDKREAMEDGARHEWEKDREDAVRMIKKIHENGGLRDSFIEFASTSHGAFAPHLIFERDLPAMYLPIEIRPEGVSIVRKKRASATGARSSLAEKAPLLGEGGETPQEIVIRVVQEAKGRNIAADEIIRHVSIDKVFGDYLRRVPTGFGRIIGAAGRTGKIIRVEKDVYKAPSE